MVCAGGGWGTDQQVLAMREEFRLAHEQANFLHRVHGSILEPEYVDNDITFINWAFPVHIQRLGDRLGSESAALMLEFYDGVPEGLRSQLEWHPSAEFRQLAGSGGTPNQAIRSAQEDGRMTGSSSEGRRVAVAPEPYLSACMAVLSWASLACRAWGWSGEVTAEHLADLMDAIHNIPDLVQDWERCDVELLRKSYLLAYQQKWAGRGGLALCDIFDAVVAGTDKLAEPGDAADGPRN
jgi:hypothetical protein